MGWCLALCIIAGLLLKGGHMARGYLGAIDELKTRGVRGDSG